MVAPALSRFVVGIGFDADRRGEREVGAAFDRLRHKGLQLGTVLAGAFSLKGLTSAQGSLDALNKQAGWLDMSAASLDAWGKVVEKAGGQAGTFTSALRSMQSTLAHLRTDTGAIKEWSNIGLDPHALMNAGSVEQLLFMLAGQVQGLRGNTMALQRVSDVTGFSMAALTAMAEPQLRTRLADEQRRSGITQERADVSAQLSDTMQDFGSNMNKLALLLGDHVIPPLIRFIEGLNNFLESDNWLMRTINKLGGDPATPSAAAGGGINVTSKVYIGGEEIDHRTTTTVERNNSRDIGDLMESLNP